MTQLLTSDVDVIGELRKLMPRRGITWSEAYSIAERQAGPNGPRSASLNGLGPETTVAPKNGATV